MINNASSMSQYSDMTSMRSMQGGRDPSQMFNKMDSDGDKSIGQAEFEQAAA